MKYRSNAQWPAGTFPAEITPDVTTDGHDTAKQARGVLDNLNREGVGGHGEVLPVRTWVSERCNYCGGHGETTEDKPDGRHDVCEKCNQCSGTGWVELGKPNRAMKTAAEEAEWPDFIGSGTAIHRALDRNLQNIEKSNPNWVPAKYSAAFWTQARFDYRTAPRKKRLKAARRERRRIYREWELTRAAVDVMHAVAVREPKLRTLGAARSLISGGMPWGIGMGR